MVVSLPLNAAIARCVSYLLESRFGCVVDGEISITGTRRNFR